MAKRRILIVDDEQSMRELLAIMLAKEGYEVVTAASRATAAAVLGNGAMDAVITDVKLPDGDGIEILRHVKAGSPETAVIVMTAFGSTQTAVAAMKLGAHDYLVKPFDVDELRIVLRNALERQDLREENRLLKAELRSRHGLDRIIGVSQSMAALFEMVKSVAPTGTTVLVTGESGTGKELVAKAIHAHSTRKDAPFVSISCAAVAETLLESELFGHVKGAFTGAIASRTGRFRLAHNGTIFLDEIGEMSPRFQVKLLRVLEDGTFEPVGSTASQTTDVRVIAATHRDLRAAAQDGTFREDLLYRLDVVTIRLPSLRERREDIPLLAEHFLTKMHEDKGLPPCHLTPEAAEALQAHDWPGNVRELRNVLERAVLLCEEPGVLQRCDLPEPLACGKNAVAATSEGSSEAAEEGTRPWDFGPEGADFYSELETFERRMISRALHLARGSKREAARLLQVNRTTLLEKLKRRGWDMDKTAFALAPEVRPVADPAWDALRRPPAEYVPLTAVHRLKELAAS
jgi:two-component system response regulator PilR (NtrC family)